MKFLNQPCVTNEPSEGEAFISEYLKDQKIKFEREVRIDELDHDTKFYRIADFYLPDYNVYLEFCGRWNNSKEDRVRYRQKKSVYYKNWVPCIYLYPENLGTLGYSFPQRLMKELKRHSLAKELFRYKLKMLFNENSDRILLSLLALVLMLIGFSSKENSSLIVVGSVLLALPLIRMMIDYQNMVVRERVY